MVKITHCTMTKNAKEKQDYFIKSLNWEFRQPKLTKFKWKVSSY